MNFIGVGNDLWQLIVQSDAITKGVYSLLLVMSMSCWTLFFIKTVTIFTKKRQLRRVLFRLRSVESFDALMHATFVYAHTYPGLIIEAYHISVRSLLQNKTVRVFHNNYEIEQLRELHEKIINRFIEKEESHIPIIAMNASIAPLLGLFGTVWGLIHAFLRIHERQSADIATIAPGIAEALMTTLAGLLVAIPALALYNCLQLQIRGLESEIELLTDLIQRLTQKHIAQQEEMYAPIGSTITQTKEHAQ